jgi:guanylate kinase
VRNEGKICILDIDVQGVRNVKKSSLECKYIFIAAPSMDVLAARLSGRGTETEEKMRIRLENARDEMAYGMEEGNFDAVVVNEDKKVEEAYAEIVALLNQWYPEVLSASPNDNA